jgi:hypothetical protein
MHGLRFFRTPGNASTGHAAFALETWSGGFGVGSALANAFGDLALIRVNQFDQARNLLQ